MAKYVWLIFLVWSGLQAGTLSGKVTANGQAVENASVYIYEPVFLCLISAATTDASGNYQAQVDDGTYYLLVSGENLLFRYVGNSPTRRDLATATLVNVAGSTTRNISAQLAGRITGTVSINGGSIQDAQVFAVDPYDPRGFSFNFSMNNLENDGDYQINGLETGCYLVGLAYRQGDLNIATPMAYYPGTVNITNATRVDVTAGETRDGIDFSLNTADLGTLQLTINPGGFQHRPSATLIDSRGYYYGVSLNQSAQTSIRLPPETYSLYVEFDDLYLRVEAANLVIQAGQTTSRTLNPNVGGSISGTINSPGLSAFQANVQVLREDTGSLVDSMSFSPAVPGPTPYIFTGLADGNYVVRVDHNPSIPGDSIMRTYFFEADSLTQASTITISGGNTVTGIDFDVQPGGSIQGDLLANGQPVTLPLISVFAVETQTNEVYELPISFTQPYSIGGLTSGNFRVGTYFSTANGNLFAGLSSNFLCSNASPSYYNNTGNQANATPVTVQFGQSVTDIDINLFSGGGVSGRVLGADCDCALQTGLIGMFQSGKLVRLAVNFNGQYEINGLNGGNYQMKLALVNPGELPDIDLEDVDLQNFNFFDLLPTYDYPGTVSVTQGSFTSLNDWCIPLNPTGNGDPGGNGGGGDDQTSLLYAWISNNAGQFESILIANNYGDTDVTATLTARRNNGASETIQRMIPAHGFLEEPASTLFPTLGNGAGYAVVLEAPSDDVRGRWVTNNLQSASGQSPSQGVAVEIPAQGESNERVGEQVLFGYLPVTNTFNAAPVIVNIGANATDVDLTFYNTAGTMVGNTTINDLQPLRPSPIVANSQVPGTGDVYMIASSSGEPITGVAFIFNGGNETAIANVTAIDPAAVDSGAKTLIYPWISNRSGQFRSILVADNLSDQTVNVTLTARRRNEAPVMANRQIPAGGFLQETASDLFPSLDGAGYTVELTANSSKVLGQWVTNNLEAASGNSPSQGIAVDITGTGDKEMLGDNILFGYLPVTNTFVSAPVVVNAGNSATDIVLYFYDEDGNEVLRDATTLAGANPKEPFAAVANTLVPGGKNVYMVARSSDGSPLAGVVFVFNSASEPAIGNATAIDFTPPQ